MVLDARYGSVSETTLRLLLDVRDHILWKLWSLELLLGICKTKEEKTRRLHNLVSFIFCLHGNLSTCSFYQVTENDLESGVVNFKLIFQRKLLKVVRFNHS